MASVLATSCVQKRGISGQKTRRSDRRSPNSVTCRVFFGGSTIFGFLLCQKFEQRLALNLILAFCQLPSVFLKIVRCRNLSIRTSLKALIAVQTNKLHAMGGANICV